MHARWSHSQYDYYVLTLQEYKEGGLLSVSGTCTGRRVWYGSRL